MDLLKLYGNNEEKYMDVKKLIQLSLKNDSQAQKRLFEQFAPYVYTIAMRYARDNADAQDITQEAFILAFNKLHQFKSDHGAFKSWLAKITVRVALHKFRRFYRSNEILTDNHIQQPIIQPEVYSSLSMEEMTIKIQSLPEGYRQIFNLYVIEGYSHREIAKMMHIAESTSRASLTRAKKILRELLNEYCNIPKISNP